MERLNLLFLVLFWTGMFLLCVKDTAGLRERALALSGKGGKAVRSSRIFRSWEKLRESGRREKNEQELSESLSYIRNLVVLGRGESLSAEYLLTELAELSDRLSPVYTDMAHYLHINEKQRAAAALGKVLDTRYASEIGAFLAGWEDVEPSELLSTVELYAGALREARSTRQARRDEMISDLVYFPVVINCMAVMLNFIYVAYFIPQREALAMLF